MSDVAFLGLGSNVSPERHIAIAIERLKDAFDDFRLSPLYRSQAVGFDGADFINGVASVRTDLSPRALRDWLRRLEDEHGRERNVPKFSDRVLDVDILLYGDRVQDEKDLPLPRPEIFHFAHVLRPLADLAPDRPCPGDGRTFAAIRTAAKLDESTLVRLGEDFQPLPARS
ncbi:MAG: 2-amino-4-hydroxy-6-hydroxymethyldihydropteridine diphosphokinase [Xanthomonadales bacterium]|nr:2-amino-4-hydroxy-6-hydroxymethyldihydropteridine diphosphokinase [Xanthomonadales bacterium]